MKLCKHDISINYILIKNQALDNDLRDNTANKVAEDEMWTRASIFVLRKVENQNQMTSEVFPRIFMAS